MMKIKKQEDIKECGLYVIQALHKQLFGKWVEIDELRRLSTISPTGMNVASMISLGKQYGIDMEGYEAPVEALTHDTSNYFIGMVTNESENHYVIFKYDGKKFHISDPAKGEYTLSYEKFSKIYLGVILTFTRREYLLKEYSGENPFTYLLKNVHLLLWIIITSLLAIIFSFTMSIFSKVILDDVLPGGLNDMLVITVITFIFVAIVRALNKFLNSFLLRKLNLIIETDLLNKYFLKMRNAPLIEINKISKIDHIRRFSAIREVSDFIASSVILIFNESIVFIVATSLLIFIDPSMFGIAFAFTAVIVLITVLFRFMMKDKYDKAVETNFKYLQSQLEKIENINSLKNVNEYLYSDYDFIEKYKDQKHKEQSIGNIVSVQNLVNEIIEGVAPIVLMYIGVKHVFKNEMSIGTIMMFVSIFNSFTSPLVSLCDFALTMPENVKNYKMIKYVLDASEEVLNKEGIKNRKIKSIEFRDVKFGYDKELINIDNLMINESISITGKNGSGKSTLLNLINLKYSPSGEILFNGIDKEYFSLEELRSKIFTGSSKNFLPSMSIYEYVTLRNDNAIKKFENSLVRFDIPELLKNLGIKLENQIINNGDNLSSGQRQIIQLLRLFAFDYDVVILDESFENIDSSNFKKLSNAITECQDAIFIEVSHSGKYIHAKKEVNIEKIRNG